MEKILAAFHLDSPDSLKRALATILGGAALLGLNPYLQSKGLPPVSDEVLMSVAGVLATFILQSGLKSRAQVIADAEAAGAKAAAAAPLSEDEAKKVLADAAAKVQP